MTGATASLLLAVVVLTGCGGGKVPADVALHESTGDGGDAALLTGRLVRDGGCLYLDSADGTRWLPVLPDDARWDGEVLRAGSARFPLGEDVRLTGGAGRLGADDVVPAGCDRGAPAWQVSVPG